MRLGLNNLGLSATPVFSPQSLFVNSEPGVHFEAYNPDTLLQRRNFAFASEDLTITTTNQGWNKTNLNAGITTGVNSYDGQPIAQTVTENTAAGQHVYFGNATWLQNDGTDLVFEGEFKYAGRQVKVFVTNSSFTNSFFTVADLQAGTLSGTGTGGSGASVTSTSITALANGYYRVRIRGKLAITDTTARVAVYLANGAGADNYTGDGVSGVTATRHIFARGRDYDTNPAYQKVTDWNTEYRAAALPAITMWQDVLSGAPVTAVEQAVGGLLDTRYGATARGAEIWDNGTVSFTGEASQVSSGVYRIYSSAGALSEVYKTGANALTVGKWYEVQFTIDSITTLGAGVRLGSNGPSFTTVGTHKVKFQADGTSANLKRASSACDIQVSNISYKEVLGNHASQSTAGSRPTLSARYNLLTKSEQLDDAYWTKTDITVTANAIAAPNGEMTADLVTEGVAGTAVVNSSNNATPTGAPMRGRFSFKRGNVDWVRVRLVDNSGAHGGQFWINLNTGVVGSSQAVGSGTNLSHTLQSQGNGWYAVTFNATTISTATGAIIQFMSASADLSTTRVNNGTYYFWGADLRTQNDAALSQPSYQRVNTSTDYDTAGFIHYLKFDGTDDGLVTGNVDFSGVDKAVACVGTTKLADGGTAGSIVELTVSSSATAGSFGMFAVASNPQFSMRSAGSVIAAGATNTPSNYAAPITAIPLLQGDISGDSLLIRVNGVSVASSTADQGTGNYSNAPIYIGRRGGSTLSFNGRITSLTIRGSAAATPTGTVFRMESYTKQLAGQAFASA